MGPSCPLLTTKKKITNTQLKKNLSPNSHNTKTSSEKLTDSPKTTTTVNLNTLSNTLSKPLKPQLTTSNTDHTTTITVIKQQHKKERGGGGFSKIRKSHDENLMSI